MALGTGIGGMRASDTGLSPHAAPKTMHLLGKLTFPP